MNIRSKFLDQPKFQDKHEHANFFFFLIFLFIYLFLLLLLLFFFFGKQKLGPSVCECFSHTPKLKLHIVPNVCKSWKDLTREMDETVRSRSDSKHPPKLEFKHTCSIDPQVVGKFTAK